MFIGMVISGRFYLCSLSLELNTKGYRIIRRHEVALSTHSLPLTSSIFSLHFSLPLPTQQLQRTHHTTPQRRSPLHLPLPRIPLLILPQRFLIQHSIRLPVVVLVLSVCIRMRIVHVRTVVRAVRRTMRVRPRACVDVRDWDGRGGGREVRAWMRG
jgi:hypothetical protein